MARVFHRPGALLLGAVASTYVQAGGFMIVLGLILIVVAYLIGIPILYTIGVILLVVGVILLLLGATGHPIGPSRYYF
jgi:hypothetical protein